MQLSEQEIIRREKLAGLRKLNINPYPADLYPVDHTSAKIKQDFEDGKKVVIAGRLMSRRIQGKASFAELQDSTGRIQVYFNRDEICPGEDKTQYNDVYKKLLDIGDFIGIEGELFTTQVGEKTVMVKQFTLLSKALKPLPLPKVDKDGNEFDKFNDPEMRYRQRYADLVVNPKVKDVDKQIKVLDSLITNILLSDQMSAPYSNLNNENVSVSKLISGALELTFVENVEIIKDDNVDDFISVDSVKMSIAIKNLIENAYKYADNDEKIKVFIGNTNKYTTVLVKDRGPGIPEDLIKNITKAFVRGKNETESGFGLGLSICYKVISAHGGRLEIQNNPRGGASFTLCIPKK